MFSAVGSPRCVWLFHFLQSGRIHSFGNIYSALLYSFAFPYRDLPGVNFSDLAIEIGFARV